MCNCRTSGARGITYESRFCILLFIRAYIRELINFKLEYQVPEAGKFDDIVFGDGNDFYLFQLKHKDNQSEKKITHRQFFNEKYNSDYNLIKYVKTFKDLWSHQKFKDKVKAAVVYTNITFEIKNDQLHLEKNRTPNEKNWFGNLKSIKVVPLKRDYSIIFDATNLFPNAKYYKFDNDPNIIKILKRQAEDFKDSIGILTENDIREALQYIVYAVNQPNDEELERLIKREMKNYFKLLNADTIYNDLEKHFRDWCDRKTTINHENGIQKQEVITFSEAEDLFQKNVNNISFGVTAPTKAFIGRNVELKKIREKLKENHDIVVSQSITITGLGGVGKTELTRQFIKKYGKEDFYGRVIWIEAESNETVESSFKQFAMQLRIPDASSKDTKAIINEVFEYFKGFKVLFVFDNFDNYPGSKFLIINHGLSTQLLFFNLFIFY